MRTLFKSTLVCLALSLISANLLWAEAPLSEPSAHQDTPKPQSSCPVMGGEIGPKDQALHVDVKGKRIYICCAACEGAVLAEPDKYIKKIEQRGETVEDAPKP